LIPAKRRPHSSLGYRPPGGPPAPETIIPLEACSAPLLSVNDSSLTTGSIGLGTDGPSNINRPAPLHLQVANVWFSPLCPLADLNCDGIVNVSDLLLLLGAWGDCPRDGECSADLNGDGTVNLSDLLILLANWG